MDSGFKTPISIADAIECIEKREYLLPAIQRKFVWSSEQIEMLFDSIMRGYPINSFMMWNVTDSQIKKDDKFYEFLKEYREFFKDENPYFNTIGRPDFKAVIDGQQRLTALYLGLKGTYAYKMPRKWKNDNEDSIPTRRLYLILHGADAADERNMAYKFQFLSKTDVENYPDKDDLFLVSDIYDDKYRYDDDFDDFSDKEVRKTLKRLKKVVFDDKLINYYQEEKQDLDTVLDIFIRTNSGGEPLSFSNLLMSFTTAKWKTDARKEFDTLIKKVSQNEFFITSDFILKCCLVLFCNNIKFKIKNFDSDTVGKFENNWQRVSHCIEVAFSLLKRWGFNDTSMRAKNAVIPIVYYIYQHQQETEILKDQKHKEEKQAMRKWLCVSLLKGVFGGQSDSVLTTIRKVLDENKDHNKFPFAQIREAFAGDDAKSLSLSDGVIENILTTQYESPNCYAILSLLYSNLRFDEYVYHKDHLHPASKFRGLKESDFKDAAKYQFYSNSENWNSILNLQLLSSSTNESKSDEELNKWVDDKHINLKDHLVPTEVSLRFEDFEEFINARKKLLSNILRTITEE